MMDDSNQIATQISDPSVTQVVGQLPVQSTDQFLIPPADQPSVSQPTDQSTSNGTQKNPLDVLEQLLSEIDGGKGGPKAGGDPAAVPGPTGPTPEEIAAEELEKRRIEFEEKQAAQRIIDEQKIEEQRQVLAEEMDNGAANVARAQQEEEKKLQEEKKHSANEGFEIIQIDHTKV